MLEGAAAVAEISPRESAIAFSVRARASGPPAAPGERAVRDRSLAQRRPGRARRRARRRGPPAGSAVADDPLRRAVLRSHADPPVPDGAHGDARRDRLDRVGDGAGSPGQRHRSRGRAARGRRDPAPRGQLVRAARAAGGDHRRRAPRDGDRRAARRRDRRDSRARAQRGGDRRPPRRRRSDRAARAPGAGGDRRGARRRRARAARRRHQRRAAVAGRGAGRGRRRLLGARGVRQDQRPAARDGVARRRLHRRGARARQAAQGRRHRGRDAAGAACARRSSRSPSTPRGCARTPPTRRRRSRRAV